MIVDLVRNDLGRVCEWGSVDGAVRCAPSSTTPGSVHLSPRCEGRLRPGPGLGRRRSAPPSRPGRSPARRSWPRSTTSPASSRVGGASTAGRSAGSTPTGGRGALNVAIRTFWFADGEIRFGTGGGITWDSDPGGEWDETELKARGSSGSPRADAAGGPEP